MGDIEGLHALRVLCENVFDGFSEPADLPTLDDRWRWWRSSVPRRQNGFQVDE
jgi:hypothetical protein